jgi:hypothetical protein
MQVRGSANDLAATAAQPPDTRGSRTGAGERRSFAERAWRAGNNSFDYGVASTSRAFFPGSPRMPVWQFHINQPRY